MYVKIEIQNTKTFWDQNKIKSNVLFSDKSTSKISVLPFRVFFKKGRYKIG